MNKITKNQQYFWNIVMVLGIFLFCYICFLLLIGSYDIGFFDKSLKILTKIYAGNGYIPYKDFAVVYPPGNFLLFGKVFGYTNESESNFLFLLIYSGIFAISVYVLKKIKSPKKVNSYELALLFLFNAFMLRMFGSTPSRYFLMLVVFASMYVYSKSDRIGYLLLFTSYLIGFWFRWDWLLMLVALQWGVLILAYILLWLSKTMGYEVRKVSSIKRQLKVTLISTLGALLGLMSMYIYLNNLGVIDIAYEFIVVIPSMLTKTYRNLPLPWPKLPTNPDTIFYINLAFVGFLIYEFIKQLQKYWREKKVNIDRVILDLVFIGSVLVFIPYALGRSDWPHFIPMWYALGLIWLMKEVVQNKYSFYRSISILILFLPLLGWLITNPGFIKASSQLGEKQIQSQNFNCEQLVKGIEPKSVFVGRTTYERYLYNVTSLYLIYPGVKPATKFITEEPGIQSSCKYGTLVAEDLVYSEKPMIAFLEEGIHPPENKEMQGMTSCFKVEEYLEDTSFEEIGECKSFSLNFKVRLYK